MISCCALNAPCFCWVATSPIVLVRIRRRITMRTWQRPIWIALVAAQMAWTGCRDLDQLGAPVPPTAAEDAALPRERFTVEGRRYWLHTETSRDPSSARHVT